MNAKVIRLIASVLVVAMVQMINGMSSAPCLNDIDKGLLIRCILNNGPGLIRQIMERNKAEHTLNKDTLMTIEDNGSPRISVPWHTLTCVSYLFRDPNTGYIFDRIAQLEKERGTHRNCEELLPDGSTLLPNNDLTENTSYFYENNPNKPNTPFIRCVTFFSSEYIPAIEEILNTYPYAQ